jgi:hypothetical protein
LEILRLREHKGVRTLVPEAAAEAVPAAAINDDTLWPWLTPRRLLNSHSRSEQPLDSSSLPLGLRLLTSQRMRTDPVPSPPSTSL